MRIGIDTGGTFTDVVIESQGALTTFKVPSTPGDPASAILKALSEAGLAPSAGGGFEGEIVHGSTVATNALLEGRTSPVALVTTEGFEDILEIGRQARPSLYDIEVSRPRPLVPRELRFGVPERVLASGEVRTPLDAGAVLRAGQAAERAGAASLVVAFVHSWRLPFHEEEAGRILAGVFHGPVTLSSRIVREFREYERFSTAAVNAAVAPVMGAYLGRLGEVLPGRLLRIMCSNGGSASPARASEEAVTTVLSGPAAGVVAARATCKAAGIEQVISFDMGGTSTDVSLIPGEIRLTGESEVAGHPIRIPAIDIHTVGAGGGSIAWVDAGGALKVGPASAGADPGPACYGRGGPATVTDANLFLGRIRPERFLGGRMVLDPGASARALGELASAVGLSAEGAASGILEVANVRMARAIRQVSLFRGHDPAAFTLCAFGGAGGLHAAELARAAGIERVLVPAAPGVFSAWGLLAGDLVVARTATVLQAESSLGAERLDALFAPVEREARERLAAETRAAPGEIQAERTIEARYPGQSHEIEVPAEGWVEAFHDLHERRYGFVRRDEEVVAVTLKVMVRAPVAEPPLPVPWEGSSPRTREKVRAWDGGGWSEAALHDRAALRPGDSIVGPAVIAEAGATTWVPGGASALVTSGGHLEMKVSP